MSGTSLAITIDSEGIRTARLGELSDDLRDLLSKQGAVVREVSDPAPDGAKGTDLVTIGSLVVTNVAAGFTLDSVVELVGAWLKQTTARRVRLTLDGDVLELDGISAKETEAVTQAWLNRHQ